MRPPLSSSFVVVVVSPLLRSSNLVMYIAWPPVEELSFFFHCLIFGCLSVPHSPALTGTRHGTFGFTSLALPWLVLTSYMLWQALTIQKSSAPEEDVFVNYDVMVLNVWYSLRAPQSVLFSQTNTVTVKQQPHVLSKISYILIESQISSVERQGLFCAEKAKCLQIYAHGAARSVDDIQNRPEKVCQLKLSQKNLLYLDRVLDKQC